jgi:CBS domain-containing protein
MQTIEAVRRPVVSIEGDGTVREAATLMEKAAVGTVAVVSSGELVGIVTDRDLVRRGLARGVPDDARVDSMMSTPVITIAADADLHEAYQLFGTHGIRRLVVTRDGEPVGMISVDDLLIDLAGDLVDLARPVTGETIFGQHDPAVPAER